MVKKIAFEEIEFICKDAYDFLSQFDLKNLPDNRYELKNGIYINVESYDSQDRRLRKHEVHKKYIDIQCIIEGEEIINIKDKSELDEVVAYDVNKDIAFYRSYTEGTDYKLKEKECLIIEPNEFHMPCVNSDGVHHVKKAVIKVPYKPKQNIKTMVIDVDGTLTDGKLYIGNEGEMYKAFNIKDGSGIKDIAMKQGIKAVIITSRNSKIVENRCKELGITEVYQGVHDKVAKINEIDSDMSEVIYMGDDLKDLYPMKYVQENGGLVACPSDSIKEIIEFADYVSDKKGGYGAIRDIIEWMIK